MKTSLQLIFCCLNLSADSTSALIDEPARLAGLSKFFSVICDFVILTTLIFLMLLLLLFFNRSATADNGFLKLTTGAEYTSGDYGGTQRSMSGIYLSRQDISLITTSLD
jgi:hypothetical protein